MNPDKQLLKLAKAFVKGDACTEGKQEAKLIRKAE